MPTLRSLRSLTLTFLAAFFVAVSLTGIATYSAIHRSIAELVDKRIAGLSEDVLSESQPGDAPAILAHLAALSRDRDTADVGFALTDRQGRWLGGNLRLTRPLPQGYSSLTPDDRIAGLTAGRALVRDAGGGLSLTTIAETEPIDKEGTARNRLYLFGFGSIVAIVVAGAILFVALVSRRIGEVQETARAIIDGDMQRRLPVDPAGGAFAEQAATFNRMLDRIAGLMVEISNVSNDIAHDMRTPLARLRSRLALIAQRPEAQGLSDEIAETIAQCDALLAMFAAALRIAEVEGGDRRAGFAMLDLGQLLAEFGEMMAPVAAESGHELIVGRCDMVRIEGDRQLLSQALINLVENALRHTPTGSSITLSLTARSTAAELSVRDNGPGIPPADRERALRRFGRLEPSRNRAGHGLGLPLADAVARLHRGALTLDDARPGLIVTMRLPLARA
ncbi:MAG: ATP-binding protein [Candidatus Sphingomonas colombiensis]|nr:ATP-binding protein [Sphingomonas sp.]WEK44705.1 MAG: ATP-binding protein [Sphingomonas sp.]